MSLELVLDLLWGVMAVGFSLGRSQGDIMWAWMERVEGGGGKDGMIVSSSS